MGITYFASWCWSLPDCCNGHNRPLFGHGPVPHRVYRPLDLQCVHCSAGQSWYGLWPRPDPAETKIASDENNSKQQPLVLSYSSSTPLWCSTLPDTADQLSDTGGWKKYGDKRERNGDRQISVLIQREKDKTTNRADIHWAPLFSTHNSLGCCKTFKCMHWERMGGKSEGKREREN